jgi:hypothetical protein
MFGLFRRKKVLGWEMELLKNTLQKLPSEYRQFERQIAEGLFSGRVFVGGSDIAGYVSLGYNPEVKKKFDSKKEPGYKLTNIRVLDLKSNQYIQYTIYISSGTINGYSLTGTDKFVIDPNNIDVTAFRKEYYINPDYKKIEILLTNKEKKIIISDDVYEVVLNNKTYFHVKDLEDGDFIGIDYDKNIYEITHDPLEIKLLNCSLAEIF